jgi:hypothetical protein
VLLRRRVVAVHALEEDLCAKPAHGVRVLCNNGHCRLQQISELEIVEADECDRMFEAKGT